MKKNESKERKKVRAELKCIELSLVCAGYDEKRVVFRARRLARELVRQWKMDGLA